MSKKRASHQRYDTAKLSSRVLMLPALALILTLALELCSRSLSPARLWLFVAQRPVFFLYNALIVLTTLTFSELFKRRRAVICTVCIAWLALGVVEYLVVKYRAQPFSSVDILMLKDAFSLITLYFTWPQIIAMFGGGFALIVVIVLLFTHMKRRKRFNLAASLLTFVGFSLLCVMCSAVGVRLGYLPQRFENLQDAYADYGFAYCFCCTFGQQGISRPDAYSTETVAEILKDIDDEGEEGELTYPVFDEADALDRPNVIFLQLESFFDVNTIVDASFSADPTPTFNRLSHNFPSGLLYVPTIGGGTANTEFEVLTGLNLDFFGAGEFPYNTILQQTAVETVNTDLKEYGYTATAMHNNSATFYSRNLVYPNLGFDRFVPLEMMKPVKYTDLGWAKDASLTGEILRALQSTESRDVLTCITVETHGKYAETYEEKPGDIEVLSLPEAIPLAPFQNFLNALTPTDNFLGDVIHALARFEEPTVVVAYGDHLPALELENDMLTTGSVYASRYIIWDNYGKVFEAPDLQAYRLGANLLRQLGFPGGVISKYHQSADPGETGEEYLEKLEVLQYDMLYGDKEAFEGESPYLPAEMTMGSLPVRILDASFEYGRLLAAGENFNEFTAILVDGAPVETAFVDENHVVARMAAAPASFAVAQVARDGTVLCQTEPYALG